MMPRLFRLDADLRIGMPTSAADSTARWNQLFPLGTFYRPDFPGGAIAITKDFLATMLSNWARAGKAAKPVDFFHRGDAYAPGSTDDKVASGWIEDLELRADGLYALIKWTDDARKLIVDDKLRYLSPTFAPDGFDRTTGKPQGPTLFGAALLNDPFLEDLPRVAAAAATPTAAKATPGAQRMDKAKLCALLGLPVDTPDEEVEKQLAAREEKLKQLSVGTDKLQLAQSEASKALSASQEALKLQAEENKQLGTRVQKLEQDKNETEVKALTRKLISEGRLLPAQADSVAAYAKALGIAEATKFYSALPVAVQLGERGVQGESNDGADSPESARKKFTAAIDELMAKGLSASEARKRVMASMPEVTKAALSAKSTIKAEDYVA